MPKIRIVLLSAVLLLAAAMGAVWAEDKAEQPAYLDTSLTFEKRAVDLVSKMTLDEKLHQMDHMASAIDRLGVKGYNWWNECLHGILAPGFTEFPQVVGMSSSWDTEMLNRVATAISDEARAAYNESVRQNGGPLLLDFWSPNINIVRDPRWGRAQESYGEDPYLSSRMGVSWVKGLQGNDKRYFKVVATPKHYAVHSGPEGLRHKFNSKCNPRDLWDTYLPVFEACIKEGGAYSIMGAYSALNGTPCCANSFLLDDILRKKWGFKGYVVSDCGAIEDIWSEHKFLKGPEEAAAAAVKAGCDLACIWSSYATLNVAIEKGLITEKDIDKSVVRLMEAKMRMGLFDPQESVPYSKIPASVIRSQKHLNLSLEAARKSLVLLKNKGNLLPLSKDIKTVAVVGSSADVPQIGNYNVLRPNPVTILQGIRDKIGTDKVLFAKGCDIGKENMVVIPSSALTPVDGDGFSHGLNGQYYANKDLSGAPALTRVGEQLNFRWVWESPAPGIPADNFSVRWKGCLKAPATGRYKIGGTIDDAARIYIDGKLIVDAWHDSAIYTVSGEIDLEAGKSYDITVEHYEGGGHATMQLKWYVPGQEDKMLEEAVELAKKADVAIVAVGIPSCYQLDAQWAYYMEDEGADRADIVLPPRQQKLVEAICATGKPVVLLLTGGTMIAIPWAQDNANAIVATWFAGERGGTAIADMLFGDFNPAGRTPVTWYNSLKDVPDFESYSMVNRTYRYFKGTPLYPFGFGLSYTTFAYNGLKLSDKSVKAGSELTVSGTVSNTGKVAGDEVVQLYLTDVKASAQVPIRKLVGFQRVSLQPGQKKEVTFKITPALMSFVDNDGDRILESGKFKLSLGGSQGDERSKALGAAPALLGQFDVNGDVIRFAD